MNAIKRRKFDDIQMMTKKESGPAIQVHTPGSGSGSIAVGEEKDAEMAESKANGDQDERKEGEQEMQTEKRSANEAE